MDEQLYQKIQDRGTTHGETYKMNFILDKQKALREKLAHYRKIKDKWSSISTKIVGILVSYILGGASILTIGHFSIPIAAAILGGISLGNTAMTNLLVEGFTSKHKKYFQQKCNHIKDYLNKMETLFIKCKEDGQICPDEFELFQKLLMDLKNKSSLKTSIKSKDIKKVQRRAKK